MVHRNRFRAILRMFRKYLPSKTIKWADFGCSNGFIIEQIIKNIQFRFSTVVGYDCSEELLDLARKRMIPDAQFKFFDMNTINDTKKTFDLVTCFETLEHVGNFNNAFSNIYNHLNAGGIIILTIPNEIYIVGLIKLLGRYLLRPNPYGDFFERHSFSKYLAHLLKKREISSFRESKHTGYDPHLGFDYRELEDFIDNDFVSAGCLELIEKHFTGFKMNVIYIYKKTDNGQYSK